MASLSHQIIVAYSQIIIHPEFEEPIFESTLEVWK